MKRWLPLYLFLLALLIRLGARWLTHFDGLYGQDPFAYYEYALTLRDALAQGQPPPPFFWPIGYPLLVIIGTLFTGSQPLAGQLVSMIMGAAIAPLVYWLVLAYRPQATVGAVVAALLASTASQLMLSSLSVMSDAAGLAWATLSALMMVFYSRTLSLRWLTLAGVTLGLAILTRWVYALLVLPWGLSALLAWWTTKSSGRQIATAVTLAIITSGLVVGTQFLGIWNQPEIAHIGDLQVVGWNPTNAFKSIVTNTDGTFHYERPIGLYYAMPPFHPAYIFPLFSPFLLLGLWALWQQGDKTSLALIVGWPLFVYLFLAGIAWENWRFPLALFSPLLVLVGIGADWAWSQLKQRGRWGLVAVWSIALIGSLSWAARDINNFVSWKEQQLATANWVSQQLPTEAALIAFGLTSTMRHYTDISTYELFNLEEANLRQLSAGNTSLYLLIDPENVQSQWQGKSPALNVDWLEAHTELEEIGRSQPFVLYRAIPQQAAETNNNLFLPAIGD